MEAEVDWVLKIAKESMRSDEPPFVRASLAPGIFKKTFFERHCGQRMFRVRIYVKRNPYEPASKGVNEKLQCFELVCAEKRCGYHYCNGADL